VYVYIWWQDLKVDDSNLSRGKLRVSIHVGQDKPVDYKAKKSVLGKLAGKKAATVGRLKLEAMSNVGFPFDAPLHHTLGPACAPRRRACCLMHDVLPVA